MGNRAWRRDARPGQAGSGRHNFTLEGFSLQKFKIQTVDKYPSSEVTYVYRQRGDRQLTLSTP
jgi:hypothetical protein